MAHQYSTPKPIRPEQQLMFSLLSESSPFNSHDRPTSTNILEPASAAVEISET
jgi:hypothetical protein